jgi:uncharacterized phage protein (TIGR01671 family)
MVREIKFRAINKRTGEIEYIDDMYWFEENGVHGMDGKGHFDEYWMDEFTGLKDKNGVEIYEGDIVRANELSGFQDENYWGAIVQMPLFDDEIHGTVVYDSEQGMYKLGGECSPLTNGCCYQDIEVIGNIHQNLELLEQKLNYPTTLIF